MSNIRDPSLSRKAGRGFLKALKSIFGRRTVERAAESWDVLKNEYARGREEAEEEEQPPRQIPHRDLPEPTSDEPPAPRRGT